VLQVYAKFNDMVAGVQNIQNDILEKRGLNVAVASFRTNAEPMKQNSKRNSKQETN